MSDRFATEPSNNGKSESTKSQKESNDEQKRRRSDLRRTEVGDISDSLNSEGLEQFEVKQATKAAQESKLAAVKDIIGRSAQDDINALAKNLEAIMDGASPEDATLLRNAIKKSRSGKSSVIAKKRRAAADEMLTREWRDGGYPYRNLMSRKNYEKQKYELQVELLKLQAWIRKSQQKLVVLFEGRDAAGKGGTIKRFMEHLNSRGARVVALEKPSSVEQGQWYFQR